MQSYSNRITLSQTHRGVWGLDTFKGCEHGINGGCYGICYANRLARAKGFDFSNVVKREFIDTRHFFHIARKLIRIPFVRIGIMCDPSHDWEYTLNIVEKIRSFNKNIVIITKHWNALKEEQLFRLKGTTVNTSISAFFC